jgi:MerR family transcriptional regulator, light-induced transcriptional regulator
MTPGGRASDDGGPEGLSAGAVARRLGVAVTTLRTWHQRYGLGPSTHLPGQHRRYAEADVTRLEMMLRLVTGGVPPRDAARWARGSPGTDATTIPAETPLPKARSAVPGDPGRRDGGGLALGPADPAARGLARAALRLDTPETRRCIGTALSRRGVTETWERMICPVLVAIGERHARTGALIEVEHALTGSISAVLAAVPRPARPATATVLLACADEEQHSLAMEALDAALAERGIASRMLGARVPPDALLSAIQRTGPTAVAIWSQHRTTAGPGQITAILRSTHRPLVAAACGPGWDPATLPPDAARPGSLPAAVDLLSGAVRLQLGERAS